jgi:hypothetical protein
MLRTPHALGGLCGTLSWVTGVAYVAARFDDITLK